MKKIMLLCFLATITFPALAQPWLKYYSAPKTPDEMEEYQAKVKAFNTYWKDKEPGHGSGYKPFMRWAWMIGERIGANGRIASDILWKEYLRKKENADKKGLTGAWTFMGPSTPPTDLSTGQLIGAGRIDCIAFHPKDTNIIYIGSPTGGLWKTTDDGNSWIPLTDNLPGLGVADIAIHPDHPDTIYIGTGDRDAGEIYAAGLLVSYDGGTTWQSTALSFEQADQYVVNRVLINPMHPDTLLAATSKGLYFMTIEKGFTQKVLSSHIKDLEFHPENPEIVYASSYTYGDATVYKSTDGGMTFTESSSGMTTTNIRRIDLAVTPDRPDMVIALCTDKESSGLHAIYRSFNQASSWTTLLSGGTKNILATEPDGSGTGGQGWYDLTLTISPDNYAEIFSGGINIWKTLNGGGSWNLSSFGYPEWGISSAPYVHVDQHILKIHPVTGALYSGNDGGIYRSYDKGETWTDISNNLGILQVYKIGSSQQKKSLVLMGSQDNSSIMTTDSSWYVVLGGDGMECIVDYQDNNTLYVSSQYGSLRRSDDGGMTFRSIIPEGTESGAWVTPYVIHPENHKTIYAGYSEIYESFNQGESWKSLTSNLSLGNNFIHLAISTANPDVLYASTGNNCWRSDDRGNSWKNIHNGLGNYIVRYFAIQQYDPHTVWAALSNYTEGQKVYYSQDGGQTWSNYSDGLPNVPVNCLVFQNNSNGTLYAGTDLGVYYRNRSMAQWEDFGNGLPNVIVNELEIFYPDSLIRAGTYGRGLWESPLAEADEALPYADFTVDKQTSCLGSPFQFYNRGSAHADSLRWIFGKDGDPPTIANKDTVSVSFNTTGAQDITLVVYKNGIGDTLTRKAFVTSVSSINVSIDADFETYFWKGKTGVLVANGADTYTWSPDNNISSTTGAEVTIWPEKDVTYHVTGVQGTCTSETSIQVDVYPNDLIQYALPLVEGTNGPFLNNGASVEDNEPSPPAGACNTQQTWCDEFNTGKDLLGHTVWFTFTGPPGGTVSIDSRGFDNQIAVYDAENGDSLLSGNYTLLAANDDYHDELSDFAAAITEIDNLTEGKTYWVQVDGSAGNTEGTFHLDLNDSPLGEELVHYASPSDGIRLFPNPNSGAFILQLKNNLTGRGMLRIYSTTGNLLIERPINKTDYGNQIKINEHLQPGLYLLSFTTGKQRWNSMLIIQ